MSAKSRWQPSTIPLHHTQPKSSLFKLRTFLILMARFQQIRMRIETAWTLVRTVLLVSLWYICINTHAYWNNIKYSHNFFNSVNKFILVVHFQQICMRTVTGRTLLTIYSIHFVLPEDSYPCDKPLTNEVQMCNRTQRVNHPDVIYQDKSAVFLKYLWCFTIQKWSLSLIPTHKENGSSYRGNELNISKTCLNLLWNNFKVYLHYK